MKLEDLVDIEQFTASLAHPSKNTLHVWSATAFEICPEKHRAIAQLRDIYLEIPGEELQTRQIISFVEALLETMLSDENRKTLIRAEALQFRRFEQS